MEFLLLNFQLQHHFFSCLQTGTEITALPGLQQADHWTEITPWALVGPNCPLKIQGLVHLSHSMSHFQTLNLSALNLSLPLSLYTNTHVHTYTPKQLVQFLWRIHFVNILYKGNKKKKKSEVQGQILFMITVLKR